METEKPSPEYLKAYNLGYWIARLMPETSQQIGQLDGKSEKNLGFQDGKKQALIEKVLTDRHLAGRAHAPADPTISKAKDETRDWEPDRD